MDELYLLGLQSLADQMRLLAASGEHIPVVWDRAQGRAYLFTGSMPIGSTVLQHVQQAAWLFTGLRPDDQLVGRISHVDVQHACATGNFRLAEGVHYAIQLNVRNTEWVAI